MLRVIASRGGRARLLPKVAALSVAFFALHALFVLITLPTVAPRTDFAFWYRGAAAFNSGADPYREFLDCCADLTEAPHGYDYPPLLAETLRPLAHLPLLAASVVWLALMGVCTVAVGVVLRRLLADELSREAQQGVLVAGLFFVPSLLNLEALQLGPLLLLLFAVAAYGFVYRPAGAWAGVALGLGGALRLSPLLPAISFARRPKDLFSAPVLAAVAATVLAFGTMALMVPATSEFVTQVLPKLGRGSAYFDNLSLPGLLLRGWVLAGARMGRVLPWLWQAAAVALVLVSWLAGRPVSDSRGRALAFAAVLATVPIISPLTWSHHLVLEVLVYVLLLPSLRRGTSAWIMALVAYPLLDRLPEVVFAALAYGLHVTGYGAAWLNLAANGASLCGMFLLWGACLLALRAQVTAATTIAPMVAARQ